MCDDAAEQSSRPSAEEMEQHMRLSCLIEAGQLAKNARLQPSGEDVLGASYILSAAEKFYAFVKGGA